MQNEEWWAQAPSQWLESAGTSTPHPDLAKNFWWQRPHRLGGLEPTEFLELASGRKAASEEEGAGARFVYLSKAVGNETRYAALDKTRRSQQSLSEKLRGQSLSTALPQLHLYSRNLPPQASSYTSSL